MYKIGCNIIKISQNTIKISRISLTTEKISLGLSGQECSHLKVYKFKNNKIFVLPHLLELYIKPIQPNLEMEYKMSHPLLNVTDSINCIDLNI